MVRGALRLPPLYSWLANSCDDGNCTTCGSVYGLRRRLREQLGSDAAIAEEVLSLGHGELRRLVERPEFYSFLSAFPEPEWARMTLELASRFQGARVLLKVRGRTAEDLFPRERIPVRDASVLMRASWDLRNSEQLLTDWLPDRNAQLLTDRDGRALARREREKLERVQWEADQRRSRKLAVDTHRAEDEARLARRVRASIGLKKAIERNDTRRISALLARGARPEHRFGGTTAIEYARSLGHLESVQLLEQGRRSRDRPGQ